jgi:hypothetical protein
MSSPMKNDQGTRAATLNRSLDAMARTRRAKSKSRALVADKTLQQLVAALVAGRVDAGLT